MEPVATPFLGWTFSPPDKELTDVYLPRELAGHPVPVAAGIFHHVDIYSADPERLVEGRAHAPGTGKVGVPPVWYFLNPVRSASGCKKAGGRKARVVAGCDRGETWHVENKKPVKGSAIGGHVRTFTYSKKSTSGDCLERLGWIMKEYDIPPQNGGGHRVLCKIYRTPRKNSRAPSSSSIATTDGRESRKRKAAGDHPEAPTHGARRRQTGEKVDFVEKLQHTLMEGSGESEHYDTASEFYTCMPAGETELPPRTQESFLPVYGTTTHMPSTCDLEELLLGEREDDCQAPEEEIQAMMLQLSREMPSTCKHDFDLKEWQLPENDFQFQAPEQEIEFDLEDWQDWQLLEHDFQFQLPGTEEEIQARILELSREMAS